MQQQNQRYHLFVPTWINAEYQVENNELLAIVKYQTHYKIKRDCLLHFQYSKLIEN